MIGSATQIGVKMRGYREPIFHCVFLIFPYFFYLFIIFLFGLEGKTEKINLLEPSDLVSSDCWGGHNVALVCHDIPIPWIYTFSFRV
jgi:hypothetical protein